MQRRLTSSLASYKNLQEKMNAASWSFRLKSANLCGDRLSHRDRRIRYSRSLVLFKQKRFFLISTRQNEGISIRESVVLEYTFLITIIAHNGDVMNVHCINFRVT